jgi:hypothetical protein
MPPQVLPVLADRVESCPKPVSVQCRAIEAKPRCPPIAQWPAALAEPALQGPHSRNLTNQRRPLVTGSKAHARRPGW